MESSSNGAGSKSIGSSGGCPVPTGKSPTDSGEGCGTAGRDSTEDAGDAGNQPASNEGTRTTVDPIAAALGEALNTALEDLDKARIKYLEAKAEARAAEEKAMRLEAAVAAMNGQPTSKGFTDDAPVAQTVERDASNVEAGGAEPSRRSKSKNPRKTRNNENNPLAHLKCAGCGKSGSMSDQIIQAPSGAYVRMLICGECRNQSLMG